MTRVTTSVGTTETAQSVRFLTERGEFGMGFWFPVTSNLVITSSIAAVIQRMKMTEKWWVEDVHSGERVARSFFNILIIPIVL